MENTDRLNLPYLMAAQAQKHVTHNEALRMLDALVHLSVTSRGASVPPTDPKASEAFLVGENATAAWQGHDGEITVFVDGFWMFHTAQEGWLLWISDEAVFLIFNGSEWVAPPVPNALNGLETMGIGLDADATNKLAVSSQAVLLTHAGNDHRLKINKSSETDNASVLFQTNFEGRAEFGTTGDDDWHVKTSADANTWNEAIVAKADTGAVSFPSGSNPDLLAPAISSAGGDSFVLGPPNLHTVAYSRANLTLVKDRVYFSAFYVDRPTELLGGAIALFGASTDSGSVIRAGVYELGTPNGDSWDVGNLVADFGTQPADTVGHKTFDLSSPTVLSPGWYVNMVGTNGGGTQVRYWRWMTPGVVQYAPFGSGVSVDFRTSGPSTYMYDNSMGAVIAGGLPPSWVSNPVTDVLTSVSYVYQMMLPKWTRW
jgi:hypothetical protein